MLTSNKKRMINYLFCQKRTLRMLFLLCLALPFFLSCKKGFDKYYDNTGPASVYVYDRLKQDSNFSMFAEGLDRVGLVNLINRGGLYTVFAPVNSAFRDYLSSKGYASMKDIPADTLFQILNYHITNNLWYYYSFQQRYKIYGDKLFLTRGGKFVLIDVTSNDTLKVNDIPVIKSLRDISADNAVIHGIGKVLIPKINLEQLLASDAQFKNSTFYKMLQVVADSAYDRFNSYDRDGDTRIDSVFYKTYSLLTNVYTSIEFKQNTTTTDQGGDPVYTNILMPIDDSLNAFIAPALARISNTVTNKIAALSPTYVQAVLLPYFVADTAVGYTANRFITKPAGVNYYSVNNQVIPTLTAASFLRTDVAASNGMVQVVKMNFPASDRLISALGQASMDPQLSMFMEALQKSNLMTTYETAGKVVTLFAPTNDAFIAAKFDVKKMVLDGVNLTSTQFANIIKNHIIEQNLATPASLTGSITTVYANNNTLTFTNSGTNATTVLGATANITQPYSYKGPTTNGYVYKIDKLLVPNQ
ncbi:fasciclin domain-containing protein [Ferruginibacter sp.]